MPPVSHRFMDDAYPDGILGLPIQQGDRLMACLALACNYSQETLVGNLPLDPNTKCHLFPLVSDVQGMTLSLPAILICHEQTRREDTSVAVDCVQSGIAGLLDKPFL